jgi:hypothetical protein
MALRATGKLSGKGKIMKTTLTIFDIQSLTVTAGGEK